MCKWYGYLNKVESVGESYKLVVKKKKKKKNQKTKKKKKKKKKKDHWTIFGCKAKFKEIFLPDLLTMIKGNIFWKKKAGFFARETYANCS